MKSPFIIHYQTLLMEVLFFSSKMELMNMNPFSYQICIIKFLMYEVEKEREIERSKYFRYRFNDVFLTSSLVRRRKLGFCKSNLSLSRNLCILKCFSKLWRILFESIFFADEWKTILLCWVEIEFEKTVLRARDFKSFQFKILTLIFYFVNAIAFFLSGVKICVYKKCWIFSSSIFLSFSKMDLVVMKITFR